MTAAIMATTVAITDAAITATDPPGLGLTNGAGGMVLPAPFRFGLAWGAALRQSPPAMTDTPPDRLSSNPRSPFFDEALLGRGVGIRFKGAERNDVEEYSLSEGWIRVALGKKVDRHGQPLTLKLSGPVEAWFRDVGAVDAGEDRS